MTARDLSFSEPSLTFCVFSYNRGRFLENCIRSIEECIPHPRIVVFDDGSDDEETRLCLESIGSRYEIVIPTAVGEGKHGGLYRNMQSALERLGDQDLLCFLQDDTQLVRPLAWAEIEYFHGVLNGPNAPAFLHPCFIRGIDLRKRPVRMLPAPDDALFFRSDEGQSAGVCYSDLCVFSPSRLDQAGWRFGISEPENERRAKGSFGPMVYLRSPFAMWLPGVGAYRGKKKTWALRVAEKRKRCGFYPYRVWSADESRRFLARVDADLPVAEDWLDGVSGVPPRPWTYNPLSGERLLKHMNNAEVFLRGLLRAGGA